MFRRSCHRLLAALLVPLLAVACGPTAEAIRPTRPPANGTEVTPIPTVEQVFPPEGETFRPTPIPLSTTGIDVFQQVSGFPVADAFEVTSVAGTHDGFVAVGFGGLAGDSYFGRRQGITWGSSDGLTWTEFVDPAFEYVTPIRVSAVGSDVYVFGTLSTCAQLFEEECDDSAESGNVIIRSIAGGAWERVPLSEEIQHAFIDDMTSVGNALALYGVSGEDQDTATLWISEDGATWTAVTDLGGPDEISSLASDGTRLVAFGLQYLPEEAETKLVASTSTDATQFAPVPVPSISGSVDETTSGAGGWTAAGFAESDVSDPRAVTLYSTDGLSWTETTASDGSFEGGVVIDLHAMGAGFAGVGFAPDPEDFTLQTGRVWATSDGRSWSFVAPFAPNFTQYGGSAVGPTGLVAFTMEQIESDEEADLTSTISAWFAPTDSLVP